MATSDLGITTTTAVRTGGPPFLNSLCLSASMRVPTIDELQTIYNNKANIPSLNTNSSDALSYYVSSSVVMLIQNEKGVAIFGMGIGAARAFAVTEGQIPITDGRSLSIRCVK